jgi:glycine/D-amino acid oxidase-like deaminating enzyme
MDRKFDYLIVGQGLAGSLLALELLNAGAKILIVGDEKGESSSKVAAGLFNPITGKRFVKTWLCDEIYPHLIGYYQQLEKQYKAKFLHLEPIKRPIENIREQNQIISICDAPENSQYIDFQQYSDQISNICNANYGLLNTKIGGWVDVPLLLNCIKNQFIKQEIYVEGKFQHNQLILKNNDAIWNDIYFKKVLFCEGYETINNPYFSWLPFNAVKGEILDVKMEIGLIDEVLLSGIFVVPIGNKRYKVGATYNWADKSYNITEEGQKELTEKLHKLLKTNFEIEGQKAGIRPATVDRRPFVGLHPQFNTIGILNGLGTKGVSLGPYFAKHFTYFLLHNKQVIDEVNINRFYSLYLSFQTNKGV